MSDLQLIHGFHAVTSRLRQREGLVKEIYFDSARRDNRGKDLLALAESRGVRVIMVDAKRLDGMTGQARHQGVAARVEAVKLPTHIDDVLEELTEPPLLLILDGVTDPHNLGACLRVADGMIASFLVAMWDANLAPGPRRNP